MKVFKEGLIRKAALFCVAFSMLAGAAFPQTQGNPEAGSAVQKVKQIDLTGLRAILKTAGKPRLINFWATWCGPCREEFPDLVRLDAIYRGRIDMLVVSLDEATDIDTYVPQFLAEMGSAMPAFLLRTDDDDAAIKAVSSEWSGSLPFTILLKGSGETAYVKRGKIRYETITAEIEKALGNIAEPVPTPVLTPAPAIIEKPSAAPLSPEARRSAVKTKKSIRPYQRYKKYSRRWWAERRRWLRLHGRKHTNRR